MGLLYRADEFSGSLKSSEEGSVYWIPRQVYEQKELAPGMHRVLEMMDRDGMDECYLGAG